MASIIQTGSLPPAPKTNSSYNSKRNKKSFFFLFFRANYERGQQHINSSNGHKEQDSGWKNLAGRLFIFFGVSQKTTTGLLGNFEHTRLISLDPSQVWNSVYLRALEPCEKAFCVQLGGSQHGLHVVKDVRAQSFLQTLHQLLSFYVHPISLQRSEVHICPRNGF